MSKIYMAGWARESLVSSKEFVLHSIDNKVGEEHIRLMYMNIFHMHCIHT